LLTQITLFKTCTDSWHPLQNITIISLSKFCLSTTIKYILYKALFPALYVITIQSQRLISNLILSYIINHTKPKSSPISVSLFLLL
jgi:hypothetical protein